MNATLDTKKQDTKSAPRQRSHRLEPVAVRRPLAEEQEAALERLLALLAAGTSEEHAPHAPTTETGSESLLRLSRLRAAHAAYSLERTGGMERVGAGAWMRRRTRRAVNN